MEQYKYKVYAIDSDYREYYRKIYRQRKLNPVQIYEYGYMAKVIEIGVNGVY